MGATTAPGTLADADVRAQDLAPTLAFLAQFARTWLSGGTYAQIVNSMDLPEGYAVAPESRHQVLEVFLEGIETLADTSSVPLADRSHRRFFPRNYRTLYPSTTKRYYRSDLLNAGLNDEPLLVNGRVIELPQSLRQLSDILRRVFSTLLHLTFVDPREGSDAGKTQRCVLKWFDEVVATFEREYITFLADIELECKAVVGRCRDLAIMAQREQVGAAERELADAIAELNGLANSSGKGRSDLHIEVLTAARAGMQSSTSLGLCSRIVAAWDRLVAYFCALAPGLEEVNPQLVHNEDLVRHLAEYEDSWAAGRIFLADPEKRAALEAWLQDLRDLGETVPDFGEGIEVAAPDACWRLPQLFSAFCGRQEGAALLAVVPGATATPLGLNYSTITRDVAGGADIPALVAAGMQASRSDPPRWNELLALVVRELEPDEASC